MNTLEALDDLTDECINSLNKIGSTATKVSEILSNKNDPVYEAIDSGLLGFSSCRALQVYQETSFFVLLSGIQRANEKAVSNVAKVKKFTILPRDFSIPTEELGNTHKLRRPIVVAKYADAIEKMYSAGNSD